MIRKSIIIGKDVQTLNNMCIKSVYKRKKDQVQELSDMKEFPPGMTLNEIDMRWLTTFMRKIPDIKIPDDCFANMNKNGHKAFRAMFSYITGFTFGVPNDS